MSIRLRVAVSERVEARPPPLESGGALGGPRNQTKHAQRRGAHPPGVGPDTRLVCAQRVLKTRPRRATILLSLAEPRRHSAENTALPGRLTHPLFVKTKAQSRDVKPLTRGPGSHSNNPYLLEHSYGREKPSDRLPPWARGRGPRCEEQWPGGGYTACGLSARDVEILGSGKVKAKGLT